MRNLFRTLVVAAVILVCCKELWLGVTQLFVANPSFYNTHIPIGSFENPGPYGGFLSICTCLLAADIFLDFRDRKEPGLVHNVIRILSSVLVITALIVIPSTQSRTAVLAAGCGLLLLCLRVDRFRGVLQRAWKKYGLLICLAVAIVTAGVYLLKKPSADGRFFMDKICIEALCSNGIKGAGIGHFGGAYGKSQYDYFHSQIENYGKDDLDWTAINEHDRLTAGCPDNAFNEYLFVGVEAGPLVMLLFMGILAAGIVISFKRSTIWCYGLTAFAVFAMFYYPLHVRQIQIMLPIMLVASVLDGETSKSRKKIPELAILSITFVIVSIALIRKLPDIKQYRQAETVWKKAEHWHLLENYDYVVQDCEPILSYKKLDPDFLFAYGQSLNKTGNYQKSDSILKMGTEISSDPMFWNVMGNNSLARGDYREAEERYRHAFQMLPNRLYPLYLLAELYHTEGDTVRFLDMADRVEHFVSKVESKNTERLRDEIREIRKNYYQDISIYE